MKMTIQNELRWISFRKISWPYDIGLVMEYANKGISHQIGLDMYFNGYIWM